ncbi:MAG: radical SAM protein [Elusimicrobiales bacterium]|nr:radical SAM protein [Elusimicrobiales bacterium]
MTLPKTSRPSTAAVIEERLRLWAAGSPQPPAVLELFTSARCNLNCLFCRRSDHYPDFLKQNSEVPDARYRALIEEGVALGVRNAVFKGGGEPLTRRDLVEFAAPRFARAGIEGLLITNGTLLDERLAGLLADSNWNEVTISLDSPDEKIHDHIRQKPGTFALAVKAARALAAAKARAGVASPSIKFHAVLTDLNAGAIGGLLALTAACGADAFELDSLDLAEPSAAALKLSPERAAAFQAELEANIDLARRTGIASNLESFRKREYVSRPAPSPDAPPCLYPWFQMSIQANGSVVPCCVAGMRQDGGRMHDMTLEQAWFSRDMKGIRAAFRAGSRPAFCAHCSPLQTDLNAALAGKLPAMTEKDE